MTIEKIVGKFEIGKNHIRGTIEEVNAYANLYDVVLNVKNQDKTATEIKVRVMFNHWYDVSARKFEPNIIKINGPEDNQIIYRQWDYKSLDSSFTPFASDIISLSGHLDSKVEEELRGYFKYKFKKNREQWLQTKYTRHQTSTASAQTYE